jgi:hypothetical protein
VIDVHRNGTIEMIVGARPLGAAPDSTAQKFDAARARAALETAQRLAAEGTPTMPGFRLRASGSDALLRHLIDTRSVAAFARGQMP